jgi:dTDP-4-amino-4,6-dideoxygalactose transaminase
MPVHLYGATVDMDPLLEVARGAGLAVVEDACQAHGARYRGRRVGALGDIGCFSFYPAKNLGAWGDGGAVVTNRPELAERVRLLRSHGERPRYRHRVIGSTARLDGLQAAVLRVKLRHLDGWNAQRRRAAAELRRALHASGVLAPPGPVDGGDHVYHLFVTRYGDRDLLRAHLTARGIASAVHYPVAVHRTEAYAHLGYEQGSLPIAEEMAEQVCSLPIFPGMDDTQIAAIAAAVTEIA